MTTVALAESAYPASVAGSRVRITGFVPFLSSYGIDLRFRSMLTPAEYDVVRCEGSLGAKARVLRRSAGRLRAGIGEPDLRIVHRLRGLTPLPGAEPLRTLDLYDFDDALHLGSISHANRGFSWLKGERRRWASYVRRARLVVAGNKYLADSARELSSQVEVVPSCVDPTRQPLTRHGERDVVTIGWIGSPTTAAYLSAVIPAMDRINQNRLKARLVVIGAGHAPARPWIEHRRWSLASEPAALASFDIGVMPLPDDPWTRGKCGYKILQYFAAGVPVVASPVGVNTEILGKGGGLTAGTTHEWAGCIESLRSDVSLRREFGAAGRALVERDYSYQRWSPALAELVGSLA